MEKILFIGQIIISVSLVIVILLQHKGSGVSAVFGGGSSMHRTKRGLEKGLHNLTILLVILFVALGVINLVLAS